MTIRYPTPLPRPKGGRPPTYPPLTPMQWKVLRAVDALSRSRAVDALSRSRATTARALAQTLGRSGVWDHLRALEAQKAIEFVHQGGRERLIVVARRGKWLLDRP